MGQKKRRQWEAKSLVFLTCCHQKSSLPQRIFVLMSPLQLFDSYLFTYPGRCWNEGEWKINSYPLRTVWSVKLFRSINMFKGKISTRKQPPVNEMVSRHRVWSQLLHFRDGRPQEPQGWVTYPHGYWNIQDNGQSSDGPFLTRQTSRSSAFRGVTLSSVYDSDWMRRVNKYMQMCQPQPGIYYWRRVEEAVLNQGYAASTSP